MRFIMAARLAFAALFVLVTWLTVTPDPSGAEAGFDLANRLAEWLFGDPALGDKAGHFLAYVALGGAAAAARLRLFGRAVFTVAALAFYGAMLEGAQALGGVREADVADAIANALGAALGFPLGALAVGIAGRVVRT